MYQAAADSLSKKFPVFSQVQLCVVWNPFQDVKTFSLTLPAIKAVFFILKKCRKCLQIKTCYRLVVRTMEKILSDDRFYTIKKEVRELR